MRVHQYAGVAKGRILRRIKRRIKRRMANRWASTRADRAAERTSSGRRIKRRPPGGLSGAAEQQADAPADLTLSERSIVYSGNLDRPSGKFSESGCFLLP